MASDPQQQRAPRREDPPPTIPGYELSDFIGRGASGLVYRARQLAVDREVAIKILHAHLALESRIVRRLQREARTTARLAHPHIVSAVDMGETDGRWWYAMEFVDGPSLAQRLRAEGRIREREALRLFIPLCEALEHLWEHGVVHRDIKPANILIDRAGGARLADLGLAVAEDDPSITGTGGTLGTPHYISPEQAVDSHKADVRSDIWSLGATLYHALCGRPPFNGESAAEVLSGVLYSQIVDPLELEPSLSKRLALVLRKCLTRDPAHRYQNPHELLLDLERVRERRSPRIRRGTLDPVHRRGDRVRRLALAIGAGLVVVLGMFAFILGLLVPGTGATGPSTGEETRPFEPLAEVAARLAGGQAKSAELLSELQGMEPRVPVRERVRYEELVRAVDTELRRAVRALRTEVEGQIDTAIHEGDLETGWRVFTDELEPRFVRATGYGTAGLASVGLSLDAWRERLALNLGAATETAVSELEALLLDWRSARLGAVDDALAQQDWQAALTALHLPEAPTVFAEAGFRLELPAPSRAGLLDRLAEEFLQRAERLQSDWEELDGELRTFVATRRTTLERQLREREPRIAAESLLRGDFESELFDRRLSREKMPAAQHALGRGQSLAFARTALDELEASARSLAQLEESLLEEDARADYAAVEERCTDALRRRDYPRALADWSELRARLTGAARFDDSPARAELARRSEVRAAEAGYLDALLTRVAERLRALDGRSIDLLWRSIIYPKVRLQVGPDPRRDGFHADLAGDLTLAELPSQQVETFAGLPDEAALAPDERLMLAAFRLHEGRAQEAQRALFSGPLPESDLARELGDDLAGRISDALERGEQRTGAREAEARSLLERVLDESFRSSHPLEVLTHVGRLLEEFSDLPMVKQQREELRKVRASLEVSTRGDVQREFERVFATDDVELLAFSRVSLGFDFGDGELGAWDTGDWTFDGLGRVLAPEKRILGWDQLAAERGMHLQLRLPFVPDNFELVLEFEALQGEVPARVLWVTAGGFQVLVCAADLPGLGGALGGEPRFLIGTEDGNAFLQRLLAGEGKRTEPLIVPGTPPRELRFKANRRSGRCELWLDHALLETATGHKAPPSSARTIAVRSWGAVRVHAVTIEGGRR